MMLLGFFVLMCLLASNHLGGAYHVRLPAAVSCAPPIGGAHHSNSRLMMVGSDNANHRTLSISLPVPLIPVQLRKTLASGVFALSVGLSLQLLPPLTTAAYAVTSGDDAAAATVAVIEKVPLLTKRTSDLQQYADIARGFKLLRPFGFNEFDGAGGGYAVKFASLFEVDENVVIGSSPSSADKQSVTDFGSIEAIGEKLAKKRNGRLVSSAVRETEGVVFYQFQFENPLDPSLPRTGPKNKRPTKGVELYQLCVSRGKLWSVQATSNDILFPGHEKTLRAALASFYPRL